MAARHLWQFGYRPTCLYPKPTPRQLFTNLVEQCTQLDIEFLPSWAAAGDLGSCETTPILCSAFELTLTQALATISYTDRSLLFAALAFRWKSVARLWPLP